LLLFLTLLLLVSYLFVPELSFVPSRELRRLRRLLLPVPHAGVVHDIVVEGVERRHPALLLLIMLLLLLLLLL